MAFLQRRNAPELQDATEPENEFLWQAYHYLAPSRGMDGGIPFQAIAAFCDFAGVDCPVQRNRIARAIVTLSNVERPTNGGN